MTCFHRFSQYIAKLRHLLGKLFTSITIEPAILLFGFGFSISSITTTTILYRKICETHYADKNVVNCYALSDYPAVQDEVQKEASTWSLAINGVSTLLSIPAILLWSAWADRKSERVAAVMIPFTGFAIPLYVYLLEDRIAAMPVWILIVGQALASCLGGFPLLLGSLNAYLADRFDNKKWLAIRLAMVMACIQLASVVGSELVGVLTKYNVDTSWIIIIGLAMIALAQIYVAVVVANPADLVAKEKVDEGKFEKSLNNAEKIYSAPLVQRQRSIFLTTFDLLKDTYKTFSRPRPQHRRTFILLSIVAAFLAGVSDDGTFNSKNLFLYRRPLNYTFEEYSQLTGASSGMGLVGTIVASVVTKLLGWTDTSLTMLSLVGSIGSNIVFAFSRTKTMVWISALMNSVGYLWSASLSSIIIKLGEPGEQATLIAGRSVGISLARFLSTLMFNAVYTETETKYPWVAWVTAAAIIFVGLLLVLVVHVGLKLQGSSIDVQPGDQHGRESSPVASVSAGTDESNET